MAIRCLAGVGWGGFRWRWVEHRQARQDQAAPCGAASADSGGIREAPGETGDEEAAEEGRDGGARRNVPKELLTAQ
ncbi:hypothetical protein GUJ93_ZPchr0009g2254 [Zizania palustris]|uniref:Uncharacterized protein n=1 Tax=Zizania palustris TaxID=103762 RepID=A0A8J5RMH1_ZIZPA|nr:hypothetical protein GUJ93_ZPchr0009g2254 [Zizania palustris]